MRLSSYMTAIIITISQESRLIVELVFDQLHDSTTNFSYLVLAPNQIACRQGNCWCEACMRARGRVNMVSAGSQLLAIS
eukprot:485615-Pleurochrysis_carterae.AAC.1